MTWLKSTGAMAKTSVSEYGPDPQLSPQSPPKYWSTWLDWAGSFIHVTSSPIPPLFSSLKLHGLQGSCGSAFAILHDLDVLFGCPRITGDRDEATSSGTVMYPSGALAKPIQTPC